jgi:hypothetical protein
LKSEILSKITSAEKVMNAGKVRGTITDNGSISKIAASLYYKAAALEYLVNSERAKQNVKTRVFNQLNKDFGVYIDSQARSFTSRLHHVYEWRNPGDSSARLWKLTMKSGTSYDMNIGYTFKQSRTQVPNTRSLKKYVFREKARIMEYRIPVTIKPRAASIRLAFETKDGRFIVLPKGQSVRVNNPGGSNVYSGFGRTYEKFFNSPMAIESIDRSNVSKALASAVKNSTRVPSIISSKLVVNKISPSSVRAMAKSKSESEAKKI